MTDALHDSIDGAITALLARCAKEDTEGPQVSVTQHVDAIQAAIKWALTKSEIAAKVQVMPPPPESAPDKKFKDLKDGFHGKSGRRAGRPPKYPRPDDEIVSDGVTDSAESQASADATAGADSGESSVPAAATNTGLNGQHIDG